MTESRRVLVVGQGAREHTLAWKLTRDGAEVLVAPGNAGTAAMAETPLVEQIFYGFDERTLRAAIGALRVGTSGGAMSTTSLLSVSGMAGLPARSLTLARTE